MRCFSSRGSEGRRLRWELVVVRGAGGDEGCSAGLAMAENRVRRRRPIEVVGRRQHQPGRSTTSLRLKGSRSTLRCSRRPATDVVRWF